MEADRKPRPRGAGDQFAVLAGGVSKLPNR